MTQPAFMLQRQGDTAIFRSAAIQLRIAFVTPAIARITYTAASTFSTKPSRIVVASLDYIPFTHTEDDTAFTLSTSSLKVVLTKTTGALSYYDSTCTLLIRENGRTLTPKDIYRNVFAKDTTVAYAQSIDGARATALAHEQVFDRQAFEAQLNFIFSDDEAIFGFGSHEEGNSNLRGHSLDLYQQNMKAVVPSFVSTRGYGILFECSSLMTFHDDASGSYWWGDCVDELDFYLIHGTTFDDITRGYHHLTGPVPMLPKWAFGFVQSKERYVNAEEMLSIVREHRHRQIPLDCIVLDWKSWPNGAGWGQKSFDPARFPNPEVFTAELHDLNARLMISTWPIMTGGCEDQRTFLDQDLMLGNQSTYNAFLPEARDLYWQQANRGLLSKGIDAWWCDCTEPFEADWSGATKPNPATRLAINTNESKLYLDPADINAYSLVHSQGIYEGQRTSSTKRVLNLTRSSYAGQHRYATVTWNGDVSATWDTLRRSIPEGLNFCATGEPWWTVDAGGFFVDHNPDLWFWRGDYPSGTRGLTPMDALAPDPNDTGSRDLGFHELYVRWLQYAAFLPMFRSHGTDVAREAWRFTSPFYEAIVNTIRWRYRLLPYLYSLAAAVTRRSHSVIRAVALEFPHDLNTHNLTDQFLFGSLLVCPITHPMFYGPNSTPITDTPQFREVYLPAGADWFNFWTSTPHQGGQTIAAASPLDTIPVFARAGSIIPLGPVMQYVDELPNAPYEIRVYTGADAHFLLYEDAGDAYAYEQGVFAEIAFHWHEASGELNILERQGTFPGLIEQRNLTIHLITTSAEQVHTVLYTGEAITIPATKGEKQ